LCLSKYLVITVSKEPPGTIQSVESINEVEILINLEETQAPSTTLALIWPQDTQERKPASRLR
jgi:hypothetical protein